VLKQYIINKINELHWTMDAPLLAVQPEEERARHHIDSLYESQLRKQES
jgi:hypothetical protein